MMAMQAEDSGLREDHSQALGKAWHPFGRDEEHAEAEVHADGGKSQSHSNPISKLVDGLKKLNPRHRKGETDAEEKKNTDSEEKTDDGGKNSKDSKSHRLSNLIHLHGEVKRDLSDSSLYPELKLDATLRRDNSLNPEEKVFIKARKDHIISTGALKKFLGLPEEEKVHSDDVPIIALGGSGGGYRACLGFLAYIEEMQQPAGADTLGGMWDLIMYSAGVSGSCWTLGGLYTFASMHASFLLDHFACSSQHHPLSMSAIDAVARSANGIYFQLAPILQKLKIGHLHPGPLDLYGTLVTSHIFFSPLALSHPPMPLSDEPKEGEEAAQGKKGVTGPSLRREWFQFSRCLERTGLKNGTNPLPLLTAVRHERPWKDWHSAEEPFKNTSNHDADEHSDPHAWWQWFEFSPIEFGSDELEGWIPTWSFGRRFEKGTSTQKLPERSLSLVLGICTSAPAGPLAAWLATLYRNLPKGAFGSRIRHAADHWVEEHPKEAERIQSHHPVHAMNEANPFFGAETRDGRGQGFENSPRIHLVDAGMSNNLPTCSFFRPGRDVDIMLLGDFSSDVQSGAALARIADFGRERGLHIQERDELKPLPEWPQEDADKEGKKKKNKTLSAEEIQERFKGRYAQVLDASPISAENRTEEEGPTHVDNDGIRYNKRHQPQADKGATLIYLPLLPNKCQPDYDPSTAPFSSSYNLVWTEEEVNIIRKTSRANMNEEVDKIRKVVRDVYNAKKSARLSKHS